jgi:tryptophan synthase alpha subunit
MQNRIDQCFERLRARNEKGFIAYISTGDPILVTAVQLALALEKAGADILELGIPFSDPLAHGIVNQVAAQRAQPRAVCRLRAEVASCSTPISIRFFNLVSIVSNTRLGEHLPNESNSKPEHDRSAHGLTTDLPSWARENSRALFHGKTEDERPCDCTRDNRASQRQRMENCVVLSAGLLTADHSQPEPNVPGTR